jgi:outer membrane protein assembly factor BamB
MFSCMGMKGLGSLLAATILLLPTVLVLADLPAEASGAGLASTPCPMYRGDKRHTGMIMSSVHGNEGGLQWARDAGDLGIQSTRRFQCGSYGITIGLNGTLYFGTFNPGGVCAIMPNGRVEWYMRTNSSVLGSTPAIDDQGNIYICTDQNDLYAISPGGELLWTGEGAERSSPLIDAEGTIYTAASNLESLVAYWPNGTLKWRVHIGGNTDVSPVWGYGGEILIHNHTTLFAVHYTGIIEWNLTFDDHLGYALCVDSYGRIYVVGERTLYAVHDSGNVLWTFDAPFNYEHFHPAIGPDPTIYIGAYDGLYAINIGDGTQRWFIPAEEPGVDTVEGIVVSVEGTVIVGVYRSIWALTPGGKVLWEVNMRNQFVSSDPVIGEDGTIYFFGDGFLYALNDEPEGLGLWAWVLAILLAIVVVLSIVYYRRRRRQEPDRERGPRVKVVEVPISPDLPRVEKPVVRDRPPP